MSAASDEVENKRESFGRKNTPEERARMQNERRKRKRKARSAKKEGNGKKVVLALEDDQARTMENLAAKNERLLYLARKYYAKWQTLHRREQASLEDILLYRTVLYSRGVLPYKCCIGMWLIRCLLCSQILYKLI